MKGHLVIFAKAPVAGAVKTRLAADLGSGRATALYRHMLAHTLRVGERACRLGGHRMTVALDPTPTDAHLKGVLAGRFERMAQGGGSLGERMKRFMTFGSPGPVVIIGADAPMLGERDLLRAFDALRGHDGVFGPAADGGYWLVGMARRRAAPRLFENVRWSSAHALDDTLKSLPSDFRCCHLRTMGDVDQADDLMPHSLLFTCRR